MPRHRHTESFAHDPGPVRHGRRASRPRRARSGLAAFAAAALIVAPLTALTPAAAADTVIGDDDFSSPISSTWQTRGGSTFAYVDVEGDQALEISNRADSWRGIETAPGVLEPGASYTISAEVRLPAAATAASVARFVQNPGPTQQFQRIAETETPVDNVGWAAIAGTFTTPATGASLLYLEVDATGTILVDNLVLTRLADEPTEPVITPISSYDFSAGLPAEWDWRQSGGPVNGSTAQFLTVENVGDNPALRVTDRDQDFDGIETVPGLLEEGVEYTVSMDVRLAPETSGGERAAKLVIVPGFTTVPGTDATVTTDEWTTITGTFTAPAPVNGELKIYVGLGNAPGTGGPEQPADVYSYFIDNIELSSVDDGGDPVDPGPTDPGAPGERIDAMSTSFEDGLDGWVLRQSSNLDIDPTVDVTTEFAYDGEQSAVVANRGNQGDGIGFNVIDTLLPGISYELSAWVRFAPGQPAGDIWMTLQADSAFQTIAQFTGLSNGEFRQVEATITMPPNALGTGLLYFETAFAQGATGNTSTFYIDAIEVVQAEQLVVADLEPIKNTLDFPVGVAIDSRETGGAQAGTVTRHFEQVTAENSMKPEAFYNGQQQFISPTDAIQVMNFARDNDLRVWGHTLVWHAQTPAFFFQTAEGAPLTTSDTDKQILRDRMREHIFNVAELYADEYGLYGDTNPIVAFDVVNEVITDSNTTDDGLRRSEWYRILGEEFIDLAFQYADEAFNDVYAAESADRPVALFINDYNTELFPKGTRMLDLLERLIDRGVPVDGVGHQMHVSLSFPVDDLGATLERFAPLGLQQAVTELDVTTGTPESEALFIDQGYFYQTAFEDFRAFHAETGQLFSATVWGLSDNRSWRSGSGGPLLFDERLRGKPAYFGVVNGELPAPQRSANTFGATVTSATDRQWQRMPDIRIDADATFQTRWANDTLYVLVEVADATVDADDAVEVQVGDEVVTVNRDEAQLTSSSGWSTVVEMPLTDPAEGDLVSFDVRVIDGGDVRAGWNSPGVLGTLTLLEPLSFVEVVETDAAPIIDGEIDAAWNAATVIETGKQVTGAGSTASATVRTLWRDTQLYVLMEVADPDIDLDGSDPWQKDSVEIYVDGGNFKNGSYRYDDTQIRINTANEVSFGSGGDLPFQEARVVSQTAVVDGGYVVEVAIDMLSYSGVDTVHGLDFQVNDAANGARQGIRNWADPSGAGFQSTARWGVGQFVTEASTVPTGPSITIGSPSVVQGGTIPIELSGLTPGAEVDIVLVPATFDTLGLELAAAQFGAAAAFVPAAVEFPLLLGSFTADENGEVSGSVTIPADVPVGDYRLLAIVDGVEVASVDLAVTAAATGGGTGGTGGAGGSGGAGALPTTGAGNLSWMLLLALGLMAAGAATRAVRSRQAA